ncbi:MAG: cysteine--tRNA ligase [Candidatus Shapirobacteria bacterium]|nr:cysteine--tRNA ligase [Candidatus Shapirobacteria bacterium]MDD4410332.1 cysteine--tRNA ligase [Candidatus Shapirobacteria bacterium]
MKFYNTLTREKQEFKPIKENEVGIYSCGPTVYSSPHIGNMYAYVCWDVLVRSLNYLGYKTNWVMNITDVGHLTSDADSGEDKMEKGSKKEGLSVWEIAKKYENEFLENLKELNIKTPWKMPRATDHINEQIELIKKIEANGFTYKISDGIYFDTSKFADYGKFANLNLEKLREGARVEINEEKKNPADFALWKFSPINEKRQMEWESPWGMGFPGWHIECTAMSTKYLGETFDIHTGGEDHINVHHTNEIAQGFGAFGHNTAHYWMHNAFITFAGSKISKSSGGLYTVKDLIDLDFDPLAYRYLVLGSHYRKGMEFSLENLKVAENALNRLRNLRVETHHDASLHKINQAFKQEFVEKIGDDLAMPEVLALVWKVAKSDLNPEEKWATILDFDKVLGLNLNKEIAEEEIPEEILKLGEERKEARVNKNWTESDRLREIIKNKGYLVEDLENTCKIKPIK